MISTIQEEDLASAEAKTWSRILDFTQSRREAADAEDWEPAAEAELDAKVDILRKMEIS